jgi:uncharacterized protein (TIGR02145 family)
MKNMFNFLRKNKVALLACGVMALLSFGVFYVIGQGGTTSIGENISIAGGLQLNTSGAAKPTCDASTRGMMWHAEGVFSLCGIDDWVTWEDTTWTCGDNFVDERDLQEYSTVQIGGQCWMAENLNYATGNSWCYAGDGGNCATYGRLYDWNTAIGACPSGWHLPTDNEQHTLDSYLATGTCDGGRTAWGCDPAGTLMKTAAWGGNNSSGFTALPAGYRSTDGTFDYLGTLTYFWSSSASSDTNAWRRSLRSGNSAVYRLASDKGLGFSVRCLRD